MRIAVYAIAKNEANNVKDWYASCMDADEVVLVDTGSTDNTVSIAQSLGITTYEIKVEPWRFDEARNQALDLVSDDIDFCIALDLDERLKPDWWQSFYDVKPETTRIKYRMTYFKDGYEAMWYWANRCHARHGYHWEYPIHEKPVYDGEEITQLLDFETTHEQEEKDRPYLEMLERAVKEMPLDPRMSSMYAKELQYRKQYMAAHEEFKRYLNLPGSRTNEEIADTYRSMAYCYIDTLRDLQKSIEYAPRRDTYIDIARYYNDHTIWSKCLEYCDLAFQITEKPVEFTSFAYAWGERAYSMAAMAAMNLGEYERAKSYIKLGGSTERLLNNLKLIQINEILSMV